ncbi:MAG TPA: YihY/virulence factor BrkB family protein, partial [Candidatus Sulfotelmatobacter sp.]
IKNAHLRFSVYFLTSSKRTNFKRVEFAALQRALTHTYKDVVRHHALQVAAALAYYLVLSAIPCIIFLSAVVGFVPIPNLFGHVLSLMARLLPADTMQAAYPIVDDILSARRATWLSFGMLGTIWLASSAFDAMIEALDIAYDANDSRPIWKTRLLAIGLAAISGTLLLVAFVVNIAGPKFGQWLAARIDLSSLFVALWPALRWSIAIGFAILAVEFLYFLAPNVKQRFMATLPGAILSVAAWESLSFALGYYFRHYANYNRTYGTLAGLIAFMVWLYWTSFALIVGAELNAELAKESPQGRVQPKEPAQENGKPASPPVSINRAA